MYNGLLGNLGFQASLGLGLHLTPFNYLGGTFQPHLTPAPYTCQLTYQSSETLKYAHFAFNPSRVMATADNSLRKSN